MAGNVFEALLARRREGGALAVRRFLLGASDCAEAADPEVVALAELMKERGYEAVDELLDKMEQLSSVGCRVMGAGTDQAVV